VFAVVPVVGRALMAAPVIADRIDVMETGPAMRAGSANQLLHDPQVQRACLSA
jgi:ABC-type branched-subunit amino acid transport system ATPase component